MFWQSPLYDFFFFFFNDTATTEIYTLSLHDALPIVPGSGTATAVMLSTPIVEVAGSAANAGKDRKSTRLNSSHAKISYAVFCLKKKKTIPSCRTHVHMLRIASRAQGGRAPT